MGTKTTTEIRLSDVLKFAASNGYRVVGCQMNYDRVKIMDVAEVQDVSNDYEAMIVTCNVVGCGVDYRRTVSRNGVYEFLLVS